MNKKITFDEIMEFYPKHNRSVYEDLKAEYQKVCLIPFVGAGLSVFCGYKSWPDVLKELTEFVFSAEKRTQIEEMIAEDKLLQAAQMICDNYPLMLKELSKIVGYEKIKNCDKKALTTSAVYVLPYLFNDNLLMTTNFDRVLEEVYDQHQMKFGKIVNPFEPDILTQIRQKNSHCLFKLHGDIGPDTHDIEKLVFTQEQYDKAYATDSDLVQELSQWFQNKRLLFLGCSLAMDKTMEVLQSATQKNAALNHYAILACKPEDMESRIGEMGELGISAIYYPDGKHEAVRVLLERLLEETNNEAYEELSKYTISVKTSNAEHRFMYNSGYFTFVGRKDELNRLNEFCQNDKQLSWWAITGPGGMGKSRLVYEFTNVQKISGWKVLWLSPSDYDNLSQIELPTDPCIVVADDVQEDYQTVGKWLNSTLVRQRSEKLRIILLEREGKELNSTKWIEMLQMDSPYDDTIESKCYCTEFLELQPMSDEELKTIMLDFAEASGKPLLSSDHAQRLLETLHKIDGDLQRPIYALAITDAWCSGKDPSRWDKTQVLDALVNRELSFYFTRLRSISQKKLTKTMRAEFEKLIAKACVMPFLPLGSISKDEYPKLCNRAEELDMEFSELLDQMGVVHKVDVIESRKDEERRVEERKNSIEAVVLVCPDLLKEYLVLKQAFDKGQHNLLFPENWDKHPMQLTFLLRVLRDYPEKLDGKEWFWKLLLAGNPEKDFAAWLYGNFLFAAATRFSKMETQMNERLERLQTFFGSDEKIALMYAMALFNTIIDQNINDCVRAVQKIENLYVQFCTNEEIAHVYAKGLVNLTAVQENDDLVQSVKKLENLYTQFYTSEIIALEYAKGLYNMTVKQNSDCEQIVQSIESLHAQFNTSEEIAMTYAQGLVNFAVGRKLDDRLQVAQKLERVYKQFGTSAGIACEYAHCLVSLMSEQKGDALVQSFRILESLYAQFGDNEGMIVEYAHGLVNLSFGQTTEEDIKDTLKEAERLLVQYPENIEVKLSYAQTKFNLTLQQSTAGLQKTVGELREYLLITADIVEEFQLALDEYLAKHPEHIELYAPLRIK